MEASGTLIFETHRPVLIRIAYRMLGSLSEAEDVVQDAFLRWSRERCSVDAPKAWLKRVVIRLSLDVLKSARARREVYVGPWLPEPFVEEVEVVPTHDITVALMLALERLSPLERAAFLLREVFEADFGELAETLGRSEPACRKLVSRARVHVLIEESRFPICPERAAQLVCAFFTAAQSGDRTDLRVLLARDATLHTDGGGHRTAALRVIYGADRIVRFFAGLARRGVGPSVSSSRSLLINGLPGFLVIGPSGEIETYAFGLEDGRIKGIYVVRNPNKLSHIRIGSSGE